MGSFISTLVFQPPSVTYKRAKKIIWLKSKDGVDIPVLYIDKKSNTTILFSHGNAEDLGMIYEWLVTLAYEFRVRYCLVCNIRYVICVITMCIFQVNILAYDYTGYGKAKGTPNEESCYRNIEAAYAHLTETLLHPPENIILYVLLFAGIVGCYVLLCHVFNLFVIDRSFGRSLGTGPSTYLAHQLSEQGVRIGGLVLQVCPS